MGAGDALALPTYSWDAGSAGGSPGSSWDEQASQYAWSVSGASQTPGVSAAPGITAAYRFDGNDVVTGQSFQEFVSATTPSQPVSFELWLRPTDLSGQEIIFETGGTTDGLSFTLDGSTLQFRAKDSGSNVTLSEDLTPYRLGGEFIQIVATIALGDQADLYVNGLLRASTGAGGAAGINDWAGNGDTGIGYRSGGVGGSIGGGGGDLGGYGYYDGDVGRIAFWQNEVIAQSEVTSRWNTISGGMIPTPEPASGSLLYGGLLALALWRRR